MRRFGPSGSSKDRNIVLENISDVILRISNEIFLDFKFIVVSILEIYF